MNKNSDINIKKIAKLANLQLTQNNLKSFSGQFEDILDLVKEINSFNTLDMPETNQVAGLTNVFRDDHIEEDRILSQKDALKNAASTHNGYFVVDRLIED